MLWFKSLKRIFKKTLDIQHQNKILLLKMPKKSYRPSQYSNSFSIEEDEIVAYSDKLINDQLIELKKYADTPTSELNPELMNRFKSLVDTVGQSHGKPEYNKLINFINQSFGDWQMVKPGSVGAYFIGCLTTSGVGHLPPGCAPLCASVDKKWKCKHNVIWTNYDGKKCSITPLNYDQLHPSTFIFVNNLYKGFNKKEKDQLNNLNLKNMYLVQYSDDGREHKALNTTPLQITDLQERSDLLQTVTDPQLSTTQRNIQQNPSTSPNTPSTGKGPWSVLFIILIIIIFILIVFYVMKK